MPARELVKSSEFVVHNATRYKKRRDVIASDYRKNTTNCKSKGFTLVELLVVITIIAILSVIGITVYSGVQKSARDARRRTDIDAIAKAMEVKFGQCQGKYCNIDITSFASGSIPTDPLETSYGATQSKCGDAASPCQYCFLSPSAAPAPGASRAHGGCSSIQPAPPTVDGGYWYNEPAVNSPGGSDNYISQFFICANLEAGGFICERNQQ